MRSLQPKTLLAVPLLAAVGSAWAAADASTLPPGWYVGASVGQSRFHTDPGNLSSSLSSQVGTPVTGNLDNTDTGYKLRAGYQFTPNLAVEGGYVDFGKVGFNGTSSAGTAGGQVKASGVNLDLVGRMPVAPNWAVLGKAGLMHTRVESNANVGSAAAGGTSRRTVPGLGVGVEYAMSPTVGIRGEWERYFRLGNDVTGKGDADLLSVGLNVRF